MSKTNAPKFAMAVLLLLACRTSSLGAGLEMPPPEFLYQEDRAIQGSSADFYSSINRSQSLTDNEWLRGPLTRLDLILVQINDELRSYMPDFVKDAKRDFFDEVAYGSDDTFFNGSKAGYSDATGRLVITVQVGPYGMPKKPMKDFCDYVLNRLSMLYPTKPLGVVGYGYSW
jgi:hypothetical protein